MLVASTCVEQIRSGAQATLPVSLAIYLTGVYLSYSGLDRSGIVVAYAMKEEKWMTTNTSFG